MDGAPQVLDELLKQGMKLGIVTNGPAGHQERKVEVLGLHASRMVPGKTGLAGRTRATSVCDRRTPGGGASRGGDCEHACPAHLQPVQRVEPRLECRRPDGKCVEIAARGPEGHRASFSVPRFGHRLQNPCILVAGDEGFQRPGRRSVSLMQLHDEVQKPGVVRLNRGFAKLLPPGPRES